MPRFKLKLCQLCPREFMPTGPAAKFCTTCGVERAKRINRERMKVLRRRLGHRVGVGKGGANAVGKADGQYKNGLTYFLRRRHEIRAERKCCERCGKNLLDAKRGQWAVHHRDHDRTNNADGNFELLCKRCHQVEHDCQATLPGRQGQRHPCERVEVSVPNLPRTGTA